MVIGQTKMAPTESAGANHDGRTGTYYEGSEGWPPPQLSL